MGARNDGKLGQGFNFFVFLEIQIGYNFEFNALKKKDFIRRLTQGYLPITSSQVCGNSLFG